MGFFEGAEEMVACPYHYRPDSFGRFDRLYREFGGRTFHLHPFLVCCGNVNAL